MSETIINRKDLTDLLVDLYSQVIKKGKGEVTLVYGPQGCGLTSLVKHDFFAQICSQYTSPSILHVECGANPTPAVLPIIDFIELPTETNNGNGAGTDSEHRVKVILQTLTSISLDLLPKALPALPFGDWIGTAKDLSDFVVNHFDRTSIHRSLDPLPGLMRWKLNRISEDAAPPIIFFDGLENIGPEARAYIKDELLIRAKDKPFLLIFGRRQNERTVPQDLRTDLVGAGLNPNHSVFVRPFEGSEAESLIKYLLGEKQELMQGNLVHDAASKICIQLNGNPRDISIACRDLIKNNSSTVNDWNNALANISDVQGQLIENYKHRLASEHKNVIKSGTVMGPFFHKDIIQEAVSREYSPEEVADALEEGEHLFLVEQNLNQKRLSTHAFTTGSIYNYLSKQVAEGYQTEWVPRALKACIRLREEGKVDRVSVVDHIIYLSQKCKDWAAYGKFVLDKCQLHDAFFEAEPLKKQVEIALEVFSQEAGFQLPKGPDDGWAEWVTKILTAYQNRPIEYESLIELIAYRARAAQLLDERSQVVNNRLTNKEERRRKSVADMIYEALGIEYDEAKKYVDLRDKEEGVVDISAYPVKYIDILPSPSARLNVYLRMQYFYHWELSHVGNDKSAAMESRFCSYKIEDLLKKNETIFSNAERADAYCALGFSNSTKERKKYGLPYYHKALTIATEALQGGPEDDGKNNLARLRSLKATAEHGIGAIHSDYKNQVAEAKDYLQRSLRTHGLSLPVNLQEQFPFESGNTFQILSSLYLAENNLDEAEKHALASIKAQKGDTSHILYAYQVLIQVYIARGDLAAAQSSSAEIRDTLLAVGDWAQLKNLYESLLTFYHNNNYPERIPFIYNEFKSMVKSQNNGYEQLRAVCGTLLTVYIYRWMPDDLETYLHEIVCLLESMNMSSEVNRLKKTLDKVVTKSRYSEADKEYINNFLALQFSEAHNAWVSYDLEMKKNGPNDGRPQENGPHGTRTDPNILETEKRFLSLPKEELELTIMPSLDKDLRSDELELQQKDEIIAPSSTNSLTVNNPEIDYQVKETYTVEQTRVTQPIVPTNSNPTPVPVNNNSIGEQSRDKKDCTEPQYISPVNPPSIIERLKDTVQSWIKSLTNGH